MAYNKRTWVGRQGTGLNKFSINGASPVTVINQPDSITEQGDALSAGNMNDLENRIYTAFEDEATARDNADTALKSAIAKNTAEIENLKQTTGQQEITVSYPDDGNYSSLMPNKVPLSVANYAEVPTIRGKSRSWNQFIENGNFAGSDYWTAGGGNASLSTSENIATLTASSNGDNYKYNNGITVFTIGHKYLLSADCWTDKLNYDNGTSEDMVYFFYGSPSNLSELRVDQTNTWINKSIIVTCQANDVNQIRLQITYANTTHKYRNVHFHDLTLIFGAGNEPLTVADALTQLPALGQYNAYDAGSLVDTVVSGAGSKDTNDNVLDTFSLSTPVTLRSAGTCVETLDPETGVLDDGKFAVVDLSQWDWTREASETAGVSYFVSGNHSDMKIQGANDTIWENVILPIYSKSMASLVYLGTTPNKSYGMWDGRGVRIRDDSYSDATTFKNAMSGVYLMYEKATYTPSSPIDPVPYNFLEVEGGGTVETIQTQTPVIDNCLDVTYDIIPA